LGCSVGCFEVLREQVELGLPEAAIAREPGVGRAKRRHTEAGAPDASIARDPRQSGALEDADVLRDRGERHVEPRRELADGRRASGEPGEDLASRRVGERAERRIEDSG